MSFLAPLFLLGGLAIAGPLIFHLVQRTTREKQKFSSLMFLQPAPPRLTRRRRLEHWLLLLLRVAAVVLLALAFARPFFRDTAPALPAIGSARRTVLLIDSSASMGREGLWAAARKLAGEFLRRTSPADELAVWAFDSGSRTIVDFVDWRQTPVEGRVALVEGRLAGVSPGYAGTHLASALMAAAEALADVSGQQAELTRQIVLISDLQEGSHLEALSGYEWPRGIEVVIKPVSSTDRTNAGLHQAAESADGFRSTEGLRVRVTNAADSKREQFQIGWAGSGLTAPSPAGEGSGAFEGPAQDIYVPPGQSRIATLPWPVRQESPTAAGDAAPAPQPGRILLRGDDEPFDNEAFIVPPETKHVKVIYLGTENPNDVRQPLYFLRRALPNNKSVAVEVSAISPDAELTPDVLGGASMAIVSARLPEDRAKQLREAKLNGKTIFCTVRNADMAETLARLAGINSTPLVEAQPKPYALLADVDFAHPLFAAFADPRFSDFSKICFWKYRRLDVTDWPGARVLARFDSRDPAVVELPAGSGRLIVLATAWNPEDSQLALSTKFAPLLASLLEWTGQTAVPPVQYLAGDAVPLTLDAKSVNGAQPSPFTLRKPDGSSVEVLGTQIGGEHTARPGIYTITEAGSSRRFAANLDPAESRTAPANIEEFERWGVPLEKRMATVKTSPLREELSTSVQAESRQKLWRWFLVAVLVAVLVECALSGMTALRAGAERPGAQS